MVRVDGPAHIAPYKVRTDRGAEGWYGANELEALAPAAAPTPHTPATGLVTYTVTARQGEAVGLTCRLHEGRVVVASVDPHSPAHFSGLTPGATVLRIGGIPVRRLSDVKHTLSHLRGPSLQRLVLSVDVERHGADPRPSLEDLVAERIDVIAGLHGRAPAKNTLEKGRAKTKPTTYYNPPGSTGDVSPGSGGSGGAGVPSRNPSVHSASPSLRTQPSAASASGIKPEGAAPSRSGSDGVAPSPGVPSRNGSVHSAVPTPSRNGSVGSVPSASRPSPSRNGSVHSAAPSPSRNGSVHSAHSAAPSAPHSAAPSKTSAPISRVPSAAASAASAASATPSASSPSVPPLQQVNLDQHNALRAQHGAPPVTYDASLAAHAQAQADECLRKKQLAHGNNPGEGQNAFWQGGTAASDEASVAAAVASWYDERKDFKKAGGGVAGLGPAGHFTQLVWKGSTKVGLGIATTADSAFVVVNYLEPGNMATPEAVAQNVTP